jgi:ABC transport system ATP-binding/permease protein
MAPPLLTLQSIRLNFGGTPLLVDAELSVAAGERLCLVGRNGSGKSTLLKIAAGQIEPDSGRRFLQPQATVAYLPQEPDFAGFDTALSYVASDLGANAHRGKILLDELGLSGGEDLRLLSGGQARRVALARVLAAEPTILLLDEPTNHLDLPAIEWLEAKLASLRSALVLVSHDRRFLQTLSRKTIWLDRGRSLARDCGFGEFEAWRDRMLEEEELRQHKVERRIAAEEDWLRYGVTGRRKRNQGRLARLQDLRRAHREHRGAVGAVKFAAADPDVASKLVIEARHLNKSFDGHGVVQDFSIRLLRGDRLGVVGANGAGKTTLINLLSGALAPDSGEVRHGANLALASLDQNRASLDPQTSLKDALTGGGSDYVSVGENRKHVMSYMKDFLFGSHQAGTPIGRLSGGERGRLMLARALAQPANLLVLDEPTNDLDLETLDLLQEMLADYEGTVILVSHDRDFLDRVAASVLVAEGEGRWREYAGGYSDMVAQRGAGIGAKIDGRKVARPKSKAPEAAKPRRKLSFKEKHALETLPERMAELRKLVTRQKTVLADADLYRRDKLKFEEVSQALARAEAELAEAEENWLAIEIRREEIEG